MKARLLKDDCGKILLLLANGSITNCSDTVLEHFFFNFKDIEHQDGADGSWSSYLDMSEYPGEVIAYVADDYSLVIRDPSVFKSVITSDPEITSYLTVVEYAKKMNKSREIIKTLCAKNRIAGAKMVGGRWLIPPDAPYPAAPVGRPRMK